MESFNIALIGKWLLRYFRESNSLWVKVINSLYGELRVGESGIILEGRDNRWSRWWRDIVSGGTDERGRWFWEGMKKQLRDGGRTYFWDDVWVGDQSLKSKFPRLFALCLKNPIE